MGVKYNPGVVSNGLVGYWDAGNRKSYPGSGTAWYDLSGNNLTMTTSNSPTFSSGNFAFNGSNQSASATNSTTLDTQTPTVEVWAKTNATSQNGFWFEKGSVNTQYSLFQEGGSIVWRQRIDGNLLSQYTTTATYVNTVNWFNVVGTFTSGSRILYINGVQVNSDGPTGTIETNTSGMTIGSYNSGGYFYNGNIAIVKVYNRVLSATEVKQNFNALRGRFGI